MTNLHSEFHDIKNWTILKSIEQMLKHLSADEKEQLAALSSNPFSNFAFLSALETSRSVGGESGWQPLYFLYQHKNQIGLFISYEKTHSYGEYVFDWAWAEAYQRNRLSYYPKLVATIPFSPVPCSKWLTSTEQTELAAFNVVKKLVADKNYSSFHYLFPEQKLKQEQEAENLLPPTQQWIQRYGHQFHWFNRDEQLQPLTSFEQYLSLMTARKRKNIIKERKKIHDAGFTCYWRNGTDVSKQELDIFYQCYHSTYNKRGRMGYLTKAFFEDICQNLGPQVHIVFCSNTCPNHRNSEQQIHIGNGHTENNNYNNEHNIVAAALYLSSDDTLYGRYWGCIENYELLHFEACYYQGIEFAIKKGLLCFNPGTQGEHKIARGFKPTLTYSYHTLEIEPFHQAVDDFCQREKMFNGDYMKECTKRLPFRKTNV